MKYPFNPSLCLLSCASAFFAVLPIQGWAASEISATPQPVLAPPADLTSNSPAVLAGAGLAQHPFLYAGEWNYPNADQWMFIVRNGKVVWSYAIPLNAFGEIQEYSDATLLSNGNVIFARKTGAALVTPDKKVLWNYDAPANFEVHVAQPLGLERVMLIQNGNPAKMMIVNTTTGATEKELILPTGNPAKKHGQFRRARLTSAGTLLAAHMDNNKVAEYDMNGGSLVTRGAVALGGGAVEEWTHFGH